MQIVSRALAIKKKSASQPHTHDVNGKKNFFFRWRKKEEEEESSMADDPIASSSSLMQKYNHGNKAQGQQRSDGLCWRVRGGRDVHFFFFFFHLRTPVNSMVDR